jgi:hypothetical protein
LKIDALIFVLLDETRILRVTTHTEELKSIYKLDKSGRGGYKDEMGAYCQKKKKNPRALSL